jgi:adenylate cyclase
VAYLYALVVLIPAMAYAGLVNMLQQASTWIDNKQRLGQIYSAISEMPRAQLRFLRGLEDQLLIAFGLLLLAVLVTRQLRLWYRARKGSYLITHPDGRTTRALIGYSLLEALRNARIPHASVCGGRARSRTRAASDRNPDPPSEQ